MPSSAVPKILLSAVLLSVIAIAPAHAREAVQIYRFGEWTVVAPTSVGPAALTSEAPALLLPLEGLDLVAFWQDGSQRAVGLHFDGRDPKKDTVVVRSLGGTNQVSGCKLGATARLKKMKELVPKDAVVDTFPDDGILQLAGSSRGLRRSGEALVADMGGARVQLLEDSPIVRKGLWDSADFCRIELNPVESAEDELPY